MTELLQGVACHMGSYSITCHPTQANTPRLNPSQRRLVGGLLDLPAPEGVEPATAGSEVQRHNRCAIKTTYSG